MKIEARADGEEELYEVEEEYKPLTPIFNRKFQFSHFEKGYFLGVFEEVGVDHILGYIDLD